MLQPSGLDYPSAARPAARSLLRLKNEPFHPALDSDA